MRQRRWQVGAATFVIATALALPAAAQTATESTTRFTGNYFVLEGSSSATPTDGLDYFYLHAYDGKFKTSRIPPDAQLVQLVAVTGWTWDGCVQEAEGTYTPTRTDWYGSWRSWTDAPGPVLNMDTFDGSIDASIEVYGFATAYTGIISDPDEQSWCSTGRGTEQPAVPTGETRIFTAEGSWEPIYLPTGRGKKSKTPERLPADYSKLQIFFDRVPVDVGGGETNAESGSLRGTITWTQVVS